MGDSGYQALYYASMKNIVRSSALQRDCEVGGGYWRDILSSVGNISVMKKDYLSQIFLDAEIQIIMQKTFHIEGVSDFLPSMFTSEMKLVAYGPE